MKSGVGEHYCFTHTKNYIVRTVNSFKYWQTVKICRWYNSSISSVAVIVKIDAEIRAHALWISQMFSSYMDEVNKLRFCSEQILTDIHWIIWILSSAAETNPLPSSNTSEHKTIVDLCGFILFHGLISHTHSTPTPSREWTVAILVALWWATGAHLRS